MILFAGYHESEQHMLSPVLSRLSSQGIAADHFEELPASCTPEYYEEPLELPLFESLIPGTRAGFRRKFAVSAPAAVAALEGRLSAAATSLLVWSPGTEHGLLTRERARALGMNTLCLLSPFYEFKYTEPLRVPQIFSGEVFVVSGRAGRIRLQQAGVAADVIFETGCPFLDTHFRTRAEGLHSAGTILLTLQGMPQDEILFTCLKEYVESRKHSRLHVRQHPAAASSVISPETFAENELLSFSDNRSLPEEVAAAWVVTSNTSFTLYESIALGRPVISWNGTCLPEQMYLPRSFAFQGVRTRPALFEKLDELYEKRNSISSAEIRKTADGLLAHEHFQGKATEKLSELLRSYM